MLFKLVPMIQDHGDQICSRVIQQIRRSPQLREIRRLPDSYLRERLQDLTINLGHWLGRSKDLRLAERYREFGRLCFDHSVPLHEAVYLLSILRDKISDFVTECGFEQTALELYAEQILDRSVGRLFATLLYEMICGYEEALREAARRMPAVCRIPLPPTPSQEDNGAAA